MPGYDLRVCAIDAVYWANFWNGDQRDEAHQVLELTPNPLLDYARRLDALAGIGPPQQRVQAVRGHASGHLTRPEAIGLEAAGRVAGG